MRLAGGLLSEREPVAAVFPPRYDERRVAFKGHTG